MSDTTVSLMSDARIEGHKSRLRQYAAVLADFHEALISERMPADAARELVLAWWVSELEYEAT